MKYDLRYRPDIFNSLDLAQSWANRCVKPHRVLSGLDGKYWVVCPRDAEKLHSLGFKYV